MSQQESLEQMIRRIVREEIIAMEEERMIASAKKISDSAQKAVDEIGKYVKLKTARMNLLRVINQRIKRSADQLSNNDEPYVIP